MTPIILQTPFGVESLYQPTLDAVILYLADKLSAVSTSFASHSSVMGLVDRMTPTARDEWNRRAFNGTVYVEVTPDALTGLGFSASLRDLPDLPPPSTVWECWGLALAVAEGLRAGMEAPDGVAVCPLFVENALQLAAGNTRVTVGLRGVGSNEKSPRQHAENP